MKTRYHGNDEVGVGYGEFGCGHEVIDPHTADGEDALIAFLDLIAAHEGEPAVSDEIAAVAPTGLEPAAFHKCPGCGTCVPELLVVRVVLKPRQDKRALGNTRRSVREIIRRNKEAGLYALA